MESLVIDNRNYLKPFMRGGGGRTSASPSLFVSHSFLLTMSPCSNYGNDANKPF